MLFFMSGIPGLNTEGWESLIPDERGRRPLQAEDQDGDTRFAFLRILPPLNEVSAFNNF